MAPSRAWVHGGTMVLSAVQPRSATLREQANMGALCQCMIIRTAWIRCLCSISSSGFMV